MTKQGYIMDIKNLISKFYDGTATLDEERELRRRLLCETLTPEVAREKELLLAMLPAPCELPEGLEGRIEALIDAAAKDEARARRRKICAICAYAAAAAVAALVALVPRGDNRPQDTFTNPDEAAIYVNDAFAHITMAFNCGVQDRENAAAQLNNVGAVVSNHINEVPLLLMR